MDRGLAGPIGGGWSRHADAPRGSRADPEKRADYDEEARRLFARLNLPPDGTNARGSQYNDADIVYKHPNGACFFIGNQSIASNKEQLTRLKIFKIVNCQEPNAKNTFEHDPNFEYMHPNFSISLWQFNPANKTPDGLLAYMSKLFDWVDARLERGQNVMVHCLAGAHRAGTAGTSYVMYKGGLDKASALKAVQSCRPFVDPIYDFKELLETLEVALRRRRSSAKESPAQAAPIGQRAGGLRAA